MQHALTRDQFLLSAITHAVPLGILVIDCQKRIIFANALAEKILGIEKTDRDSETCETPSGLWQCLDSVRRPIIDKLTEFCVIPESPQKGDCFEYQLNRSNDVPALFSIGISYSTGSKPDENLVIATIEDITEQRRVETELRDSEEMYRTLFEHAGFGITLIDPQSRRRVAFNRKLHERLGYTREEYEKLSLVDIQYNKDREAVERQMRQIFEKKAFTFEELQRNKQGEPCHVLVSAVLVTIGGKEMVHAISLDITENRQMEEQLRQAQKMEAVGRLAGGVAHDFNNLLNVILGYAELALFQTASNAAVFPYLKEIKEAATRSADLTKQLLAFSRKQLVKPRVVKLNEIIASQLKMLTRLIGEEISIEFKGQEDLWSVRIDPTQIHQILANLTVNARDAISGVGLITIETANATFHSPFKDNMLELQEGDYVQLTIRDNGAGIPANDINHIFEPFFTTKEAVKGTGLGLSTVYGIVKQNRGAIRVFSQPGDGAVFQVYFHRFDGAPDDVNKTIQGKQLNGSETILVVEDEQQVLELSKNILEKHGYRVLFAQNPEQAWQLFKQHCDQIDLLLTDVVMPEMNGKELEKKIRTLKPAIRTLFMSGYESNFIAERGVIRQDVNFIQKPFTLDELVAKVRQVIDG
jgi:PAS domain S-box-containing protein